MTDPTASKGIFSDARRDHDQDDSLRRTLTENELQGRQISALLAGQEQLTRQMAEVVTAHHEIVRRHVEDLERVARIERTIGETAVTLAEVKEVVSTVAALKGGLKVLGWLGTAAKWLASIAAAFALVWALVLFALQHTPHPPK